MVLRSFLGRLYPMSLVEWFAIILNECPALSDFVVIPAHSALKSHRKFKQSATANKCQLEFRYSRQDNEVKRRLKNGR